MNKNTIVETAKNGQATNNIQSKRASKITTGKVKTLKSAEERRKAREEQYKNFRIGALKRRCLRYGISEEDIAKYVEKLIEQLNAPKQYSILVMLNKEDEAMFKEALTKVNIQYNYHGDTYFSFDGDQSVLAKLREIAPPKAKIHPYAKKMESVLSGVEIKKKEKKPTNNTAEVKTIAKAANKGHTSKSVHYMHRLQKGRIKTLADIRKKYKKAHKLIMSANSTTAHIKAINTPKGSKMAKKAA